MFSEVNSRSSQIEALETIKRALEVMKRAKKLGVDVKPAVQRIEKCRRAFMARGSGTAIRVATEVIDQYTGLPRPAR